MYGRANTFERAVLRHHLALSRFVFNRQAGRHDSLCNFCAVQACLSLMHMCSSKVRAMQVHVWSRPHPIVHQPT